MGINKAIKPRFNRVSPVAVDPLRHEPLVAEAFLWNGAALDTGEALGKGDLFRRRQTV
jgi:hypothetical protein